MIPKRLGTITKTCKMTLKYKKSNISKKEILHDIKIDTE